MSRSLILLTGATGHIGWATLLEALKHGYNVRACVRRESAVDEIKLPKSIQPYLSQLSFTTVLDITEEGAFDEVVKGVDYILHIASPLASNSDDYEKSHIRPAVKGTTGILYSALKEPSVKKVVITASVGSVRPQDAENEIFTPDNIVSNIPGPFPNSFAAYKASKVRAHNSVLEFIEEKQPSFDVINIMPAFVLGPNQLARTPEAARSGSNRVALGPLLGAINPLPISPGVVHIDDVAFLHVASLSSNISGHQNVGASWPGKFEWNDITEIIKKKFPEEVKDGTLPLGGSNETSPSFFDVSRTESMFDFKFKDLEHQLVDLVQWYIKIQKGRLV